MIRRVTGLCGGAAFGKCGCLRGWHSRSRHGSGRGPGERKSSHLRRGLLLVHGATIREIERCVHRRQWLLRG